MFCGIFVQVNGWGSSGHRITARLAQSELTGPASDWVRYLVPWHWNGTLSAMASWADDILYPNTNPTGFDNWQWSRPLHFINTPDWSCNYIFERDCINDSCVDGAIRNYTKRLESSKLDDIQHQEALYFLIHYVGDIHQPLHTGFTSDLGGNKVRGRFMNMSNQNLHTLWDSGLIDYRIKKDFFSDQNLYYEYIHQLMMNQSQTSNDNDIEQWIKENLEFVCQEIYFDEKNETMNSSMRFDLDEMYYRRSYPIIEQRLAQGGRRLGALLNRLGQNPPRTSTQNPPETSTQTQSGTSTQYQLYFSISLLIAALSVQFIFDVTF
jgi:hypothetical protein